MVLVKIHVFINTDSHFNLESGSLLVLRAKKWGIKMSESNDEEVKMKLEAQKEKLRNFIRDSESWDQLEKYASKQNIFKILSLDEKVRFTAKCAFRV